LYSTTDAWAANTFSPTNNTTKVKLDAGGDSYFTGGNVGIGTTSPASLLHVGSTAYELSSGAYLTSSHQRTAKMVIHADDANTDWDEQEIGLALHNEDPTNNNWSPHIAFTTHEDDDGDPANANPVAVAAISATYNTRVANGWAKGDLVFFTNNAGSGNAERMRITSDGTLEHMKNTDAIAYHGRAAIGHSGHSDYAAFGHLDTFDTGGYALLQYADGRTFLNAEAGQSIRFRIHNNDKMILTNTGDVGIGTTAPDTLLHVSDDAEVSLSVDSSHATGSQISIDATGTGGHEWRLVSAANGATGITDDTGAFGLYSINGSSNGYKFVVEGTTGNVGIGTTSPAVPFHVAGGNNEAARFEGSGSDAFIKILEPTGSENVVLGSSFGTGFVGSASNNNFAIRANNSNKMFITPAGNVGIGTTPVIYSTNATTLQVHDATISELRLTTDNTGTATGNGSLIQSARAESTDNLYIWNAEAGKTIFATSATERMRIDASGNVGIGSNDPASLLHVGSNAYELSSGAYLVSSEQRNAKMVIHADDANTNWYSQEIGLALHNEDPTNNNWSPHIAFTTHEDDDGDPANANPVAVAAISATYNTRVANGWTKGDLVFFTNNAGSGNAERMRITSDGNVGIGTTAPGTLLHVSDDAEVSLSVDSSHTTGSQISIDATGTGGHEWRLVSAANGATGITDDTGAFGLYSINGSNNGYKFVVEGTTGNVGIGTTSPAFPLEVDGFISTASGIVHKGDTNNTISFGTDTQSFNTAGSARMTIAADGAVAVAGAFSAATKSFDIEHPTKEGKRLHHGSLEGPEHGVYIRGRLEGDVIELPDYWLGLVDEDTITVQLTPNKGFQQIYVDHIEDNKVYVGTQTDTPIDCFYFIQAERKDVDKMEVEYDAVV
jgi:hypothetical protein